jgi:hypothetical protein
MLVAVKRELVSVLLKNLRHRPEPCQNAAQISNPKLSDSFDYG